MRNTYHPIVSHATRSGAQPATIDMVREQLDMVEKSRAWSAPLDPTSEIEVEAVDGQTVAINGMIAEPHAFNSIKNYTRTLNQPLPQNNDPLDTRRLHAMRNTASMVMSRLEEWDSPRKLMLRTQGDRVIGVATDRYRHLPYNMLLNNFPNNWVVPRFAVDNAFCEVNVCHPDLVNRADGLMFGARILTSDVTLCRATMLAQMLKLVCSNGMIGMGELEIIKRFHLVGWTDDAILMEWDEKTKMFVANFDANLRINRDQLSRAAKTLTTKEQTTDMLKALGVGQMRIDAALAYAELKYGLPLNRYSVGQGLTYVSQTTSREGGRMASVRDTTKYDFIATQYMAMAA